MPATTRSAVGSDNLDRLGADTWAGDGDDTLGGGDGDDRADRRGNTFASQRQRRRTGWRG
jgi:hypothetical protein